MCACGGEGEKKGARERGSGRERGSEGRWERKGNQELPDGFACDEVGEGMVGMRVGLVRQVRMREVGSKRARERRRESKQTQRERVSKQASERERERERERETSSHVGCCSIKQTVAW